MASDTSRKVNWEFRVQMTKDLLFMVEKRIDAMIYKYLVDVMFRHEILNQPPRIVISMWANAEEQLLEFVQKLMELSMFDIRVYPHVHSEKPKYRFKRMFVLYYQFDEYSYQKETE